MRYFPVFLDLQNRPCLVVGETEEARRKAGALRDAGAVVTHVDDTATIPAGPYALALISTGNLEQDEAATRRLAGSGALINVVDRPSLCSFVWPAIVERGPVTIAVSTAGTSPTLAALIRQRIERAIPAAVGELAQLAGRLRRSVAEVIPTVAGRRLFWRRALEGKAGALAFAGRDLEAQAALRQEARMLSRRAPRA